MATFLLVLIYVMFIGLGLPDSVFGAAWPAIYQNLNLPASYASFVTVLMSLCTATTSYFSARLIAKFGTGLVTTVSTVLTAAALLGFALSPSFIFLIIFAIPLGVGAGAIDSALNNYVATHYKSSHMSFLHCFYGVGVSASPFILSLVLVDGASWRNGYFLVFIIQTLIAVFAIVALPLWRKVRQTENNKKEVKILPLSFGQMVKMKAVRIAWIMFFASVSLEFVCGIWGSTYLVQTQNVTSATAAKIITFYYLGITAGRFLSGLISSFICPQKIVCIGYSFIAIALVTLFLPLPLAFKGIALFLIGFGNGPFFPNMTYLTPINFGEDISQSIIGTQMVACNLGISLMPPLFGFIAGATSFNLYPIVLALLFAIMIFTNILYAKAPKQKSGDLFKD